MTDKITPRPMDTAPKDGTMLRLFVRFDGDSNVGPFEDTGEGWTIGTNNMSNTGEDRWDIVGWDWEQDTFRQAHTAVPLGWLPFHGETVVHHLAPMKHNPDPDGVFDVPLIADFLVKE